jgi:hypothetical protein
MLREPVPFDLRAIVRTPAQAAALRTRLEAQHLLAERLRPGPGQWKDMDVFLSGATLVDLDLSGCEAGYVEFVGAQFHGTTRFDGSRFDRSSFTLDGPSGRATFHGDVVFAANPPAHVVVHGTVARPAYTPSVTEKLPTFPWNDGEGEEGWFEGIDLSFDTWKHDEHLPFDDAEIVWQELLDRLEEEDVSLTAEQRRAVRSIFDRIWPNYKVL